MELRKLRRRIIWGIVLGVFCSVAAEAIECYTPLEWQPKLGSRWNRDTNNNNVEDSIEEIQMNPKIDILLDLNDCATPADLERFSQFGTLGYIARSISIVQLRGVLKSDAIALGNDLRVAMVERDYSLSVMIDVSKRSLRVRESFFYSPFTLEDQIPLIEQTGGAGITIAFIDTGILDGPTNLSLPVAKFVGGYNTFTGLEGNPEDNFAHGTLMADIALGKGGSHSIYPVANFPGVAVGARLVDIKVFDGHLGGTLAKLIAGFDKCIERHSSWSIDVVNVGVSTTGRETNGLDAGSQAANRVVQEGMVVVVPTPRGGPIEAPGAADDVITIAESGTGFTIRRDDDGAAGTRGPRLTDGDGDSNDELKPDVVAPSVVLMFNHEPPIGAGSASAALVSAVAALVLQFNSHLRPLEVKQRIIDAAEDLGPPGWDKDWGHGLVDAYNAVNGLAGGLGGACRPTDLRAVSIAAENPHIVSGVPNALRGSVCNDGPEVASSFQVRLSAYLHSDSSGNYPVCTVTVGPGLGVGDCTHVRCDWTPRVSGTSSVEHACVKEEVIYSCDLDSSNHYAQQNLVIHVGEAVSATQIVNPTAEDLNMEILPRFSPACGGWSFSQSDPGFFMAAAQCGRVVTFNLAPRPGTTGSCKVDVAVEGVRPDGSRLSFPGVTLLGAVPEPEHPLCVLSGTSTDARGRKLITIKAQDTKSGLAGINVVKWQNASVRLPAFEPGGTGAVYVTSTKLDQSLSSSTELDIIDAAGNVKRCDPLHVILDRQTGNPVTETFTGIPQAERYLSVHNGSPGVTNLRVEVNGQQFQVGGLKPGEVREMDLGSAMVPGNGNTVSFIAQGKPGGEVVILLHD
jgi:hypothetical protein